VREQLRLAAATPGLAQFLGYRRSWLRGDVMAGLTVATYLVPQAMAYATVAGLSPVAGLWASLLPLVIYALDGIFALPLRRSDRIFATLPTAVKAYRERRIE
jgi:MFS superfamily sulfate permease-like transporter